MYMPSYIQVNDEDEEEQVRGHNALHSVHLTAPSASRPHLGVNRMLPVE